MATKLDSPVKSQIAVGIVSGLLNGECRESARGILARRRRVFVQTETGCVMGMELERGDNANTIKRRLQLALNVPADDSSLTFGDRILSNDLSAIRNHSPLLLARNVMHRSSSNPCLSPTEKNLRQWDRSGPVEILGCLKYFASIDGLIKDIVVAIKKSVEPIPVHSGLGGAYYFRNIRGESVAIVKPTDEEPYAPNNPKGYVGKFLGKPGLKHSVRVGETGFREVAAYLLDVSHFANVPPTVLVKVTHSIFNLNYGVNGDKIQQKKKVSKIASLQQFIPHDFDAGDYGTSSFPVAGVHRIGILDIRIFNTDRHAGNILVKLDGEFGQVELIPIDHGLCLPEHLEDPYFEWIHWPQASIPFSEDELEYIRNLDPIRDCEMLKGELPMIREACLRVLVLSTIFLKEAAAYGLCLAEIGEMMSREFGSKEEKPSELEGVCIETRRMIANMNMSSFEAEEGNSGFMFDIDCVNAGVDPSPHMPLSLFKQVSYPFETEGANCQYLLSKLDECFKENIVDLNATTLRSDRITTQPDWYITASKLSMSLKKLKVDETNRQQRTSTLSVVRSAEDKLPTSSIVKLADMSEEKWVRFLDKFRELLHPAFGNRRAATMGERKMLGTSCKFVLV